MPKACCRLDWRRQHRVCAGGEGGGAADGDYERIISSLNTEASMLTAVSLCKENFRRGAVPNMSVHAQKQQERAHLPPRFHRELTESRSTSHDTPHKAAATFLQKPSVLVLFPRPPAPRSHMQEISGKTSTAGYEGHIVRTHFNTCATACLTPYSVVIGDENVSVEQQTGPWPFCFHGFR